MAFDKGPDTKSLALPRQDLVSMLTDYLHCITSHQQPNRPVSLPDHIATVCGYLNDYSQLPPQLRNQASERFFSYLTSVSWRKNHRRINRWVTVGLIVELAWAGAEPLSPQEEIEGVIQQITPKPDRRLASRLLDINQNTLNDIVGSWKYGHVRKLDNLLEKCKAGSPILYTMDTMDEFHHLLVATLVAYARTLQMVYKFSETLRSLEQERIRENDKHERVKVHLEKQEKARQSQLSAKIRSAGR